MDELIFRNWVETFLGPLQERKRGPSVSVVLIDKADTAVQGFTYETVDVTLQLA